MLGMAGVSVVVILRQQVNIMQKDTAPFPISQGLAHPDIQQFCTVKCRVSGLETVIFLITILTHNPETVASGPRRDLLR